MIYYPCFISFRHFDDEISVEFIKQFEKCLTGYLNPLVGQKPFIDYNRMAPGYDLKPAITDALCQSACMLVIWSPKYFDTEHVWCAKEFIAMTELEANRLRLLPQEERIKKLIIPVIYRGSKYYPRTLADGTLYLNFEKFGLYEPEMIKNQKFAEEIEKLAEYIYERLKAFERLKTNNPIGRCPELTLRSDSEALQYIEKFTHDQEFPR